MKNRVFTTPIAWALLAACAMAQQPASNDASVSGISVGSQAAADAVTNLPPPAIKVPPELR